jgi:hypothetical protein
MPQTGRPLWSATQLAIWRELSNSLPNTQASEHSSDPGWVTCSKLTHQAVYWHVPLIFITLPVALRKCALQTFAHTSSCNEGRALELACHLNANLLIRNPFRTKTKTETNEDNVISQFALPSTLVSSFIRCCCFFIQFCNLCSIYHFRLEETFPKLWRRYQKGQ